MPQPKLADVVADARVTLNDLAADAANQRHSTAQLERYGNDGLNDLFLLRPDLFFGQFSSYTGQGIASSADLPVHARYRHVLADYVVWRAEMKDDESVNNARMEKSRQFFVERLRQ